MSLRRARIQPEGDVYAGDFLDVGFAGEVVWDEVFLVHEVFEGVDGVLLGLGEWHHPRRAKFAFEPALQYRRAAAVDAESGGGGFVCHHLRAAVFAAVEVEVWLGLVVVIVGVVANGRCARHAVVIRRRSGRRGHLLSVGVLVGILSHLHYLYGVIDAAARLAFPFADGGVVWQWRAAARTFQDGCIHSIVVFVV